MLTTSASRSVRWRELEEEEHRRSDEMVQAGGHSGTRTIRQDVGEFAKRLYVVKNVSAGMRARRWQRRDYEIGGMVEAAGFRGGSVRFG